MFVYYQRNFVTLKKQKSTFHMNGENVPQFYPVKST